MRPLLASFFDSLDGVTYFFVSSGIFILLPAVLFFCIGLWIGALTWGRFKRRFRAGQETIEDMKNELALLKRRTAELASRPLPHQAAQVRSASRSQASAAAPQPGAPRPPKSSAFTLWTEARFEPAPNVVPRPARESPPARDRAPAAPEESLKVKSIVGFPKAGAGTPIFDDWLQSQTTGPENGRPPVHKGSTSPAEAYRAELNAGIVRNDYLLGIVFNTPPEKRDDLSRLDGISASECEALRAYGVHSFKQIGLWDREHADEFARRLGLKDKARAVKWIDQAVRFLQESGGAS